MYARSDVLFSTNTNYKSIPCLVNSHSFFFFLMWTTFKIFIEFVTILFPFHVLVFARQACGFLAPQPGIEPAPPALGSKVLTTGQLGMSLNSHSLIGKECIIRHFLSTSFVLQHSSTIITYC